MDEQSAVGVRARAHPTVAPRGQCRDLRSDGTTIVEELAWAIALEPCLELGEMLGVASDVAQRHLVRAEGPFGLLAVHDLRSGPALWAAEDDQRPARPRRAGRGASAIAACRHT